jgi:hypothetical protein
MQANRYQLFNQSCVHKTQGKQHRICRKNSETSQIWENLEADCEARRTKAVPSTVDLNIIIF